MNPLIREHIQSQCAAAQKKRDALWLDLVRAEEARKPYEEAFLNARAAWSTEYQRAQHLKELLDSEQSEPAEQQAA